MAKEILTLENGIKLGGLIIAFVQLVTMWFLMGGKITTVNNHVEKAAETNQYN